MYLPGTKRRGGKDGVEEEVGVEKGWEKGRRQRRGWRQWLGEGRRDIGEKDRESIGFSPSLAHPQGQGSKASQHCAHMLHATHANSATCKI